jgi:hypothetical protein
MSIGRALQALALYDILTNLIPGAALLSVVMVIVPGDLGLTNYSSGVLVASFLVFSFILGHFIQFVGSRREGTPTTFGETVGAIDSGNPSRAPLRVTHIEKESVTLARKEFDLPQGFDDYGRLLQLLLSHLETTRHTRALRFQAVHAFHRSMWAASEISLYISSIIFLSFAFQTPSTRTFLLVRGGIVLSTLSWFIFNNRREKFDRKFIEYTFIDFYEDITSKIRE